MFDLEKSISEWRKQMFAAGIKTPAPLEELEIHLREEIEQQMKSGISVRQAFEMTVLQIGQAKELKSEFAKDRRLKSFLEIELIKKEWDLKWGPVLHAVIFTGMLVFIGGMVLFKKGSFSGMTSIEQMSSLTAAIVSYLLFSSGLWGYRFFPVIISNRVRLAIYVCGAVLVSLWLMVFLVHMNVNIHQFQTEFFWAFLVPAGIFSGLVLGFERAVQKKVGVAGS